MRLLAVHAERFAFAAETPVESNADPEPPASDAEERADSNGADASTSADLDECIVAVVGVERGDATGTDTVAAAAADEVRDVASQLGETSVALVPGADLVDRPAEAADTAAILRSLADALADAVDVVRAPVGWHLACELVKRGHPFAAQTRQVTPAPRVPPVTAWHVRFPDGERVAPRDAEDRLSSAWATAVGSEVESSQSRSRKHLPRDLLVGAGMLTERDAASAAADAASATDPTGEDRCWLPRGAVVRDALLAHVADNVAEVDAAPVETPDGSGPLSTAPDVLGGDGRPWRRAELGRPVPEVVAALAPGRADAELVRSAALVSRVLAPLVPDFLPVLRASEDRP
jgi:hypothetical protein